MTPSERSYPQAKSEQEWREQLTPQEKQQIAAWFDSREGQEKAEEAGAKP